MNEHINQLLSQMATLEAELRTAVQNQESRVFFQIKGKPERCANLLSAAR